MSELPSQAEFDEANASHIQELTARITELETANKGLQIAMLDANEKEKELQLREARMVDAAYQRGRADEAYIQKLIAQRHP